MSSLVKAFAFFSGASFIGALTQVAKGKITTVFLGTEGVGILNQLTNLWSLFSLFSSLGFYNGMVRHLAPAWDNNDRQKFRRHMSSSALLMMSMAIMASLVGCVFSNELADFIFNDGGDRGELVCFIMVSIPVFIAGQTYRAMLNASRSISAVVRARIGADILSVFVLLALIFPFGIRGAIMGYIGLHLLYLFFTAYFTKKVLGADFVLPSPKLFDKAEIRQNLGYGASSLVSVAVGLVTTLLISRWIIIRGGTADNGLFTMALKVATVYLGGFSASAGGYYFPTLSNAKTDEEMFGYMNKTLSMFMFAIPPVILALMVGGKLMMHVLFSEEFVPAAVLLLLILPGDLFRILAETIGMALTVKKRLVLSTGSYILWALVYLGLVAFLLPKMGILGVALAYLFSHVYNALQQFLLGRYVLGYRFSWETLGSIVRGFSLVGAMALAIWLCECDQLNWLVAIVLTATWVGVSWFDHEFRNNLRNLFNKIRIFRFFI